MDEDDEVKPPSEDLNDYDGDEYDGDDQPPPPDEEVDEDEEINEMYGFVLDSLLFPPHVKEQLMQTQPKEKKLLIINMHKHLIQNKKGIIWGEQQNSLLKLIKNSKRPSIQDLITLRSLLATGNKDFLTGFLEADGIYVLMKCIDERIAKLPMTDLDASILYEVIFCCKCTMNNDIGMEGLLATPGAIEHIAKSLLFEWKPIALAVLEILAVCCYYSEDSSTLVKQGLKSLSKMRNEAPFQCLCQALINEDIEVKAAVAVFVNSMIMGMDNVKDRNYLRGELTTQLYSETFENVLVQVRAELERLENSNIENGSFIINPLLTRRKYASTQVLFPTNDQSETASTVTGTGDNSNINDLSGYFQAGKGKNSIAVNPSNGTMAGVCYTIAKDTRKFTIHMPLMTKEKLKIQPSWYELDSTNLKFFEGIKERGDAKDMKMVIPMTDVVFIRDFSTDQKLVKEVRFTLEIETTEGDVVSLGCETAFEKDSWITALTVARDLAVMKRSAYRLVSKELTVEEFKAHAEMYIKQGTIYYSMLADDREMVVTSEGLDTSDPLMISEFIYYEMVAMGQLDQYHEFLQLLLLLPPGTPKLWKFLIKGLRRLVSCSISDEEELDDTFKIDMNTLVKMLENKSEELGGSIYPQVTKLAMSVMTKETELRQMRLEVNRSSVIMERVKNDMSESLHAVDEELSRRGGKYNEIREMLRPILEIPDRHLSSTENDANNDDLAHTRLVTARRRSSSVTDVRYEMYTRMLKSLPESALVREKMLSDGFSETEINDFFGIDPTNPSSQLNQSMSSLSLSSGGLNIEKYKKMLRLLPASHIREKMLEVGFPDKEIDEMIGPYDPNAPVTTATTSTPIKAKPMNPKFEKYFKMMKMFPEEQVRHKMKTEGMSESEIEDFFRDLLDVAVATAQGATIVEIDPKFEKFIKMSKMLPEGAVKQKMSLEKLSDADIEYFYSTVLPASKNSASSGGESTSSTAVAAEPAIDKFEKFRKQQKVLPEPAIRRNMQQDGISAEEIEKFFNGDTSSLSPVKAGGAAVGAALGAALAAGIMKKSVAAEPEKPPEGMPLKEPIQPNKKMKGLFWTKLKNADVPGTLWSEIEEFKFPPKSQEMIDVLFSAVVAKTNDNDKDDPSKEKEKKKSAVASVALFDSKRVQGVSIFLGRIRKSSKEVRNMIIKLDPKILNSVLTETILTICPTIDELNTVKVYDKPEQLDLTGQLFYELSTIPRLELRLKCHEITFKWDSEASEASTNVGVFLKACMELRRTKQIIGKLLSMVLSLGNYLNGGTPRGQAYGVKLDFMAKLNTIKLNPISRTEGTNSPSILCGPTVLHFLAFQAEVCAPEILQIASTWENVWIASGISFSQMELDIKSLENQLQKLKNEVTDGVPIIRDEGGEEMSEPLKERLSNFLLKAEGRMHNIQTHLTETSATLKTTMCIFGETNSSSSSSTETDDTVSNFFTSLSAFIKAFQHAYDDNKKLKDEETKKARKANEAIRLKEERAARLGGNEVTANDGNGIFADFRKNQTLKADEIIAFQRMEKKMSFAFKGHNSLEKGGTLGGSSASRPNSKTHNTGGSVESSPSHQLQVASALTGSASTTGEKRHGRRRPSLVRDKDAVKPPSRLV